VIKPAETDDVKQIPATPAAQQDKSNETLGNLIDTLA
jgi:hypothetical protein